jgi:hypothetical protein
VKKLLTQTPLCALSVLVTPHFLRRPFHPESEAMAMQRIW